MCAKILAQQRPFNCLANLAAQTAHPKNEQDEFLLLPLLNIRIATLSANRETRDPPPGEDFFSKVKNVQKGFFLTFFLFCKKVPFQLGWVLCLQKEDKGTLGTLNLCNFLSILHTVQNFAKILQITSFLKRKFDPSEHTDRM